jgi:hypothetical protein
VPPHLTEAAYEEARERYYLRSLRAAVEETYWRTAWRPEAEVRDALVQALERRGIEPEPEAVRRGAALLSRGRRPAILAGPRPV